MGGRDDISWTDIKRMLAELAVRSKETDRQIKELKRQIAEQGRQIAEQGKQIVEQGRQLGGIGDKFGYFAEGMALPTMEALLRRRFHMENVAPRHRVRRGQKEQEYDVLAWANGKTNTAIVVEVKSRVKRDAIPQLIRQIESLFDFLPELAGKTRMGILAGIDWDIGVEEEAQAAGLFTARIWEDVFELTTRKGFKPRKW
ncbi:MAG: hypothetical protein N2441_05155 [Rhodocyclaceae bacterium]|nr:hypothetical protein [Rhodocyclaceae bacterium]